MLTDAVQAWEREGTYEVVGGRRLFVRRREGSGPRVVLLHGFPSSSFDWAPLLAARPDWDVLTFDFLGFGLSDKPADHVYSLSWQADAVEELVRRAGHEPVVLVAHDMGTSVATELLARDLRGELHDRARPRCCCSTGASCWTARVRRSGSGCCAAAAERCSRGSAASRSSARSSGRSSREAHPLTRQDAADHWSLVSHGGGHRLGHKLIHYMDERDRADRSLARRGARLAGRPVAWHGACWTPSRRRRCSTGCASCGPGCR